MTVDTDLRIDLLRQAHADELYQLTVINRDCLKQWLPWLDAVRSVEDTKRFIAATAQQFADDLGFQAAVIVNERIAGVTGFHPIDKTNNIGSIGYWLGEAFQGRGYMTKSVAAAVDIGFRDLGLNRIEIRCAPGNLKSCAVAQRLNFSKEGVLRESECLYGRYVDHIVYAMLKSEFESA